MIMLRSTHSRLLAYEKALNAQQHEGAQAIITLLSAQLENMGKLVFPTQTQTVTPEAREVDAVLSGSDKAPELSDAQQTAILEGQREFDLLLSGNYDQGFSE